MGFGGPVWHASVAPLPGKRVREPELKRIAFRHLAPVGDREHEWEEYGGYAFHLRRRLTVEEQRLVGEAIERFERLAADMFPQQVKMALDEIKPLSGHADQ